MAAAAIAVASSTSCSCGGDNAIVYDVFQPDTNPPADAVHTYASHAQVPLRVRSRDLFVDIDHFAAPEAGGSFSIDPDADSKVDGDVLTFAVLTGDAGDGTLTFKDKDGNEIASRTFTVKDPEAVDVAVTAPERGGLELPAVDVNAVRIHTGGKAAFRTTLTAGGDEVVGLDALVAGALPDGFTTRNASGCAVDSCDAVRNAFEISVATGAGDAADVTAGAGSATVTFHVVPATDADIADVVMDEADLDQNGKGLLVAHVVTADNEPVFGAPVAWQIDGEDLVTEDDPPAPQHGDALTFDAPAPSSDAATTHDVTASVAGHDASTSLRGDSFAATSITGACGSVSASTAPVWALLVVLGAGLRTRSGSRRAATGHPIESERGRA